MCFKCKDWKYELIIQDCFLASDLGPEPEYSIMFHFYPLSIFGKIMMNEWLNEWVSGILALSKSTILKWAS